MAAAVAISMMFIPSVMPSIVMSLVAIFAAIVTPSVFIIAVERRSFMDSNYMARSVSIVAISARQMVCIHPAASFRIHIDSTAHVIIDTLLRKIIIIVIA